MKLHQKKPGPPPEAPSTMSLRLAVDVSNTHRSHAAPWYLTYPRSPLARSPRAAGASTTHRERIPTQKTVIANLLHKARACALSHSSRPLKSRGLIRLPHTSSSSRPTLNAPQAHAHLALTRSSNFLNSRLSALHPVAGEREANKHKASTSTAQ